MIFAKIMPAILASLGSGMGSEASPIVPSKLLMMVEHSMSCARDVC